MGPLEGLRTVNASRFRSHRPHQNFDDSEHSLATLRSACESYAACDHPEIRDEPWFAGRRIESEWEPPNLATETIAGLGHCWTWN